MNFEMGQASIGKLVVVSNGVKRPPERFNKKLEAWEGDNFSGVLEEISETSWYESGLRGKILVGKNSVMTMYKSVDLATIEVA